MPGRRVIASTRDPDGRLVQLDARAWDHVLEEHAEMTEHLDDVMSAIDSPDHREPDPRAGRQRYFRRGGPMAWVRVITEFVGDEDRIVTAFPQSNDPSPGR